MPLGGGGGVGPHYLDSGSLSPSVSISGAPLTFWHGSKLCKRENEQRLGPSCSSGRQTWKQPMKTQSRIVAPSSSRNLIPSILRLKRLLTAPGAHLLPFSRTAPKLFQAAQTAPFQESPRESVFCSVLQQFMSHLNTLKSGSPAM